MHARSRSPAVGRRRVALLTLGLVAFAVAACHDDPALVGPAEGPAAVPADFSAAVTPAAAVTGATFVGAGDIASCSSTGDEATATLLDGIAGTVFTAGDNVYSSGTPTEFT